MAGRAAGKEGRKPDGEKAAAPAKGAAPGIDFAEVQKAIDARKGAAGTDFDFGAGGGEGAGVAAPDAVETGIPGLDGIMEGGFPKDSLILLAGACGTGKSILGMQFLHYGASKKGEPGVYVSLEEEPDRLVAEMENFGWDIRGLMAKDMLAIVKPEIYESDTLRRMIGDAVERIGAKRLVIDSYTLISSFFEKTYDVRKSIITLSREVKKLGCTTIAISDIMEGSSAYSISGFEEFLVDGVLVVSLIRAEGSGAYSRALLIRKMRNRTHSLKLIPFNIEKEGGIMLFPEAEVFE